MWRLSLILLVGIGLGTLVGFFGKELIVKTQPQKPILDIFVPSLDKYTIESLAQTVIKPGKLMIGEKLEENDKFNSRRFTFEFNPSLDEKITKTTTGQVNIPTNKDKSYPVVLMLRGYVDQKIYQTGIGTRMGAEVLTQNGFITIAPDFLGYGGSDKEAENIFESRFQTYITAISLLNSMDQLPTWDRKNIFIWGHSNGGQIALTILEITKGDYPTALWAPVSKPFPYSILYYTDESEDRGKLIRKELSKFEANYDPDLYSIDRYYDRIKAPIQLHQGTADDAVPKDWSDKLAKTLKAYDLKFDYYVYSGADHNLQPAWNTVIQRDIIFFKEHMR